MLIAMAGLPGTGKSTLARAVIAALRQRQQEAYILDKDTVRAALFPPGTIAYSREQDDLCVDIMLQVATYLLRERPARTVILDGRTFSRSDQVAPVVQAAAAIPAQLCFVECVCAEATALARLEGDLADQRHPAENRGPSLYRRMKAEAQPLEAPHHLIVDTAQPVADAAAEVLAHIKRFC
jgi:adenylylsulfate kinase